MFLRRTHASCLLGSLLAIACAAPATAPETVLQTVAEGVWLLPGRFPRDRQPDGNSLVLQGSEGLIVVDSGSTKSTRRPCSTSPHATASAWRR